MMLQDLIASKGFHPWFSQGQSEDLVKEELQNFYSFLKRYAKAKHSHKYMYI